MNAPFKPDTAPTLEQRLRFIDLTFECFQQACQAVEYDLGWMGPALPDEPVSDRSKQIGRLTSELRLDAMRREGLPLSLLCKRDREALFGVDEPQVMTERVWVSLP
jgi:hypothetical protein